MRTFPKPGFYTFKDDPEETNRRVYYISGTTKGNKWFDDDDTDGEWTNLVWTCVITSKEAKEEYTYSSTLPENLPLLE